MVTVICAAAIWGAAWYRSRTLTSAALYKRLPASGALVVYLDFSALRRAGILDLLDSPKVTEEPEYEDFVRKTDFNYKQDLDSAMLAFAPAGKYLLLRGHFDWKNLRSYVESENGSCYNSLCRMQGSTQDRRISFFPIQSNLMALAVSDDESAAVRMQTSAGGPDQDLPDAPVWVSIPNSVLHSTDLPAGTRPFARSMERAESVVLSFVPQGSGVTAKLSVRCHNSQDAGELVSELSRTTAILQQAIAREHHTPNPADLSGVLTAGKFRSEGDRVYGSWPIERVFLDTMLAAN